MSALGPFLLDNALTGRAPERNGNRLPWLAPQGCYPCRGSETWVAVTVAGDDQWRALASLVGGGLADDDRFTTVDGRLEHHDLLDERIAAWTARRSAAEVATLLQEQGIAAHEVHDCARRAARPAGTRPAAGSSSSGRQRFPDGDLFGGHPIRLSETPGRWWRGGPSLGQDTVEMLTRHAGPLRRGGRRPLREWSGLRRRPTGRHPAAPLRRLRPRPRSAIPGGRVMGGPWTGVRVVETSGLTGAYATRMWAALGAHVVVVEPPDGHPLRHLPPFAPGHEGPEASLWWAFFAQGKRSAVAEAGTPEHARLVASADVVIGDVDPAGATIRSRPMTDRWWWR